jgi:predicted glycoside hydrolase/deacetylase ChbG (UPF0249 family)
MKGDTKKSVEMVRSNGCTTTNYRWGYMLGTYDEIERNIIEDISHIPNNESAELLFHPGYESKELAELSSMRNERERDVKLAKSKNIQKVIKKNNVSLSTYIEASS